MENFYKRNESVLPSKKQTVIRASYQWVVWKGKAEKKNEKVKQKQKNVMTKMKTEWLEYKLR